jgi:hypothetical protein
MKGLRLNVGVHTDTIGSCGAFDAADFFFVILNIKTNVEVFLYIYIEY